ncbi:MAG TPA: osmoprotectant transporter permease [Saprospiraceae bacterium]|nr:osmoprotectant transporter permease [Saprospiraceae bacterium]
MTFFWILWAFSALMSLIPIYFFFVGLADGSITSKNMGLWALILLIVAAVLVGTLWLKGTEHLGLAKIILILAAIPGLFTLLYFLIVITSKAKWN